MAELVVDPLEMVDVHDENGQRTARAPDPQHLLFRGLAPVGGVGQPGLGVGTCRLQKFGVQQAALEQERRRRRGEHEQGMRGPQYGQPDGGTHFGGIDGEYFASTTGKRTTGWPGMCIPQRAVQKNAVEYDVGEYRHEQCADTPGRTY